MSAFMGTLYVTLALGIPAPSIHIPTTIPDEKLADVIKREGEHVCSKHTDHMFVMCDDAYFTLELKAMLLPVQKDLGEAARIVGNLDVAEKSKKNVAKNRDFIEKRRAELRELYSK